MDGLEDPKATAGSLIQQRMDSNVCVCVIVDVDILNH